MLVILVSITVVAFTATPTRGQIHTSNSFVASKITSTTTNTTQLVVQLLFPNGTSISEGKMYAGSLEGKNIKNQYVFGNMTPGTYQLNLTGVPEIYFPSAPVKVSEGANFLNITVYQLEVFDITVTAGPILNNSSPGPTIKIQNDTMVRFVVHNNTTLIQNLAVVSTVNATQYSSILFDSLSNTIGAGGTTDDTFIVSKVGTFYYECLIGNDAKDGEYGSIVVV